VLCGKEITLIPKGRDALASALLPLNQKQPHPLITPLVRSALYANVSSSGAMKERRSVA
jgi:hypothetical protein